MKKIKKQSNCVVNIILLLFISFIIICFLSLGYSKFIKKDRLVNIFGYTRMIVKSNSMYPKFSAGDKLIIKLGNNVKVGDIVTYNMDNTYITHRVTQVNGEIITTKGDYNNTEDTEITKNMIVGVVKYIIK